MDFKDFEKLALTRQACREFNGKSVNIADLEKIANLARFSPSACNSQPWKMYCVNGGKAFDGVKKALTYAGRNMFLGNAGGFICITEKSVELMKDVGKKFGMDFFVKYDIGELIAYITLTAKSMGIESCIIGWMDKDEMSTALDLPKGEECNIAIALGYSDIEIRKKVRKNQQETVIIK